MLISSLHLIVQCFTLLLLYCFFFLLFSNQSFIIINTITESKRERGRGGKGGGSSDNSRMVPPFHLSSFHSIRVIRCHNGKGRETSFSILFTSLTSHLHSIHYISILLSNHSLSLSLLSLHAILVTSLPFFSLSLSYYRAFPFILTL